MPMIFANNSNFIIISHLKSLEKTKITLITHFKAAHRIEAKYKKIKNT